LLGTKQQFFQSASLERRARIRKGDITFQNWLSADTIKSADNTDWATGALLDGQVWRIFNHGTLASRRKGSKVSGNASKYLSQWVDNPANFKQGDRKRCSNIQIFKIGHRWMSVL
jgi:hypothetical protein